MRARGFTLLEVLVALVVFAVAAVALGSAYVNVLTAYDLAGKGSSRDENIRFARAALLAEPDRKKAETGDDFETPDNARVRWHATIESTDTADLFRVTFVCETTDTGPARPPRTETFMLLRPTWSEGGDAAKLHAKAKERIQEINQKRKP
jgi:general secretion pathway protein I